jgi:hypothetical protein
MHFIRNGLRSLQIDIRYSNEPSIWDLVRQIPGMQSSNPARSDQTNV